jgi:class 3 adenylate cyclase
VWELLADTDRLNRLIGLPVVDYGAIEKGLGAVRPAFARVAGVPLRWRENPFQWEKGRGYTVAREYTGGPLRAFEGGIALDDLPDHGTRVHIFATLVPASVAGVALVPLIAHDNMRKTLALVKDFAGRGPLALQARERVSVNSSLLCDVVRDMKAGNDEPLLDSLAAFITSQPDRAVAAIRPHFLARLWDVPVLDVVRLGLRAVKAGILNLQWSVLCPNCRVVKVDTAQLGDVKSQFHCDVCGIDFKTQFDKFVELRFAVHPAIRRAESSVYCIGGPSITPHIWAQKIVRTRGEVEFVVSGDPQQFRLRALRLNHVVELSQGSDEHVVLTLSPTGWSEDHISRPAAVETVVVHNACDEDVVVALEETDWHRDAFTGAQATTLQEFRDLFATEVLAPGHEVGIEQMTFFFSDLRDSTALYESAGDAAAYGRVRRHFDYLTHHIARNNGAVVKTIGDAVMAVFTSPVDAVRAALEIQRGAADAFAVGDGIVLRVGLHCGAAFAVNSNGVLDYFGRSVNIAARIESAATGGDVVLSEAMCSRADVRRVLAESAASLEPFQARFKGIDQTVPLVRVVAAASVEHLRPAVARRETERRARDRRGIEI